MLPLFRKPIQDFSLSSVSIFVLEMIEELLMMLILKTVLSQIHSLARLCTETQWQGISPPETQLPGVSPEAPQYRDLQKYQEIVRQRPLPVPSYLYLPYENLMSNIYISFISTYD